MCNSVSHSNDLLLRSVFDVVIELNVFITNSTKIYKQKENDFLFDEKNVAVG